MQCTCFFPPRPFKHHCDNYLFIYIFTQRQDDQSLLLFSCSSVSNSFWPHGLQHTRLPCPSLYPSLPKFMSIDLMMPSNHLILCHLLLLLPSIFPSIRVFFPRAYYFNILSSRCSQCINIEIRCAYKQNNIIKTLSSPVLRLALFCTPLSAWRKQE